MGPEVLVASRNVLALAGVLCVLPAVIHAQIAAERASEWWGYGAVFLALAVAQLGILGALARRPSVLVVQLGLWGSLAAIVLYLVSHTSGVPFGPDAGTVPEIEALGLAATVAEAALVVLLAALLGELRRRTLNLCALLGALLWVAALSGTFAPPPQAEAGTPAGEVGAGHGAGHDAGTAVLPTIPDAVRNAPRAE